MNLTFAPLEKLTASARLLAALALAGLPALLTLGASTGEAPASGSPPLAAAPHAQPSGLPFLPLSELRPGQRGEVWTVFRGTQPEPFEVELTGVIYDALGPGKSLILCQLTDPRVQNMGAVAGMSGSPLYIEGRLAGALSYQVQKFETVRYAGFTPIEDLLEVGKKSQQLADAARHKEAERRPSPAWAAMGGDMGTSKSRAALALAAPTAPAALNNFRPLSPVFAVGGLAPRVVDWLRPQLAELGLQVAALGGQRTQSNGGAAATAQHNGGHTEPLAPGDAVAVALTTGDISLAATGTVSYVEGERLIAFGHPMMSLGEVALPMARAEIVTILPSSENSFKVANTGELVGTINQDRLSAVAGHFGAPPMLIPIEISFEAMQGGTRRARDEAAANVDSAAAAEAAAQPEAAQRSLRFAAVQHPQLSPLVIGAGVAQATFGTNEAGLTGGARIVADFSFADEAPVHFETLLAGPQSAQQGISDFVQGLNALMQNPYALAFPTEVKIRLRPLAENPMATIESATLSRSQVAPGESLTLTLQWRDFQGATTRTQMAIPVAVDWLGKSLEVLLVRGDLLDQAIGRQFINNSTQLRSFSAYLDFVRQARSNEGLHIAVVERAELFLDQAQSAQEWPSSLTRIAQRSDIMRYQKRSASRLLWSTRILPDRLLSNSYKLKFRVVD